MANISWLVTPSSSVLMMTYSSDLMFLDQLLATHKVTKTR